ncbi:hypothetical protein ACIBO9_23970 [Streptomyces prunicolor]|uniref:hypothetical protein n=1 Tax=Streptomyces prunicolor TaxID=67348 RepID=UPI0037D831B2
MRSDKAAWSKAAEGVGELCDGLAGVLEKTGNDQLRTDEAIKAEIAGLKVRVQSHQLV